MIKCRQLEAVPMGGSSLTIVECGGVSLAEGESIVVRAEIADRLKLQYRPKLKEVATSERISLKGGHYEVLKPSREFPGATFSYAATEVAPSKLEKEDKVVEKVIDVEAKSLDTAPNKSMRGRRKAKKKKKVDDNAVS